MTTLFDPARHLSRYVTQSGIRIYSLNVLAFMQLRVHVFLVVCGDPAAPSYLALIDMGSAEEQSRAGLQAGLDAVRELYGEQWSWETLSRLVLTHPHPDHVGGLNMVRSLTGAPLAAHAWAVDLLRDPQAARDAAAEVAGERYAAWLGASEPYATRLRRRAQKPWLAEGVTVQTVLHGGEKLDGIFDVLHVPGHEGAQLALRLENVLLSADHLLPRNSPPLMPGWVRRGSGLALYLSSLSALESLEGVDLVLGSHDEPMHHWRERIAAVRERYDSKLAALLDLAGEPLTVQELTLRLHPRLPDPQALLLLDQTAALAEYLTREGRLTELPGPPARFVRTA